MWWRGAGVLGPWASTVSHTLTDDMLSKTTSSLETVLFKTRLLYETFLSEAVGRTQKALLLSYHLQLLPGSRLTPNLTYRCLLIVSLMELANHKMHFTTCISLPQYVTCSESHSHSPLSKNGIAKTCEEITPSRYGRISYQVGSLERWGRNWDWGRRWSYRPRSGWRPLPAAASSGSGCTRDAGLGRSALLWVKTKGQN